ncbi:MAG: type VI secretion system baseplate subunit TssK [Planctomycetes bacterium]|nr:type VI secretion system baseplate subunit TssK [Planctomycetota bacterium]
MQHRHRVLWSEGMFLAPQHFQQADRFHEALLATRLQGLHPLAWGISELGVDLERLAAGEFALSRCAGVLPDGQPVDLPGADVAPPVRAIAPLFKPELERLGVFLALPAVPEGGVACGEGGQHEGRATRYKPLDVELRDETAGPDRRPLRLAAGNFRILFEGEALDDHTWMRIAELGRGSTGGFALVESFAPPCLRVGASARLMGILRRLLEVLNTKCVEFSRQRRDRGAGFAGFTTAEAASFWLLHTVNGFIPPLQHYFQTGHTHPETVYLELSRLAGYLFTFASEGYPRDLPAYQHDDPAACFARLEDKLKALLDTIIPTKCTNIALKQVRDTLFVAGIQDDRVLQQEGGLYLAAMANVPAEKVAREAPLKFKISSQDRVDQLITAALRGISVRHLSAPPPEIPVQPGRQYFQVDKVGEHWEAVRAARNLAVYLPPEFAGLKLELMAVKE